MKVGSDPSRAGADAEPIAATVDDAMATVGESSLWPMSLLSPVIALSKRLMQQRLPNPPPNARRPPDGSWCGC